MQFPINLLRSKVSIYAAMVRLGLIGGAILAVLVLPWLAEIVTATMPGGQK